MLSNDDLKKAASQGFGLAPFLEAGSKILHSSLFDSKNIGRITDLLIAQNKFEGFVEFKLRLIFLLGVFDALQFKDLFKDKKIEPILIECGCDENKIGISIKFKANHDFSAEKIAKSINEDEVIEDMNEQLMQVLKTAVLYSDRNFLRSSHKAHLIEFTFLIGTTELFEGSDTGLEWYEIKDAYNSEENKTVEYIELGDLDYSHTLDPQRFSASEDGDNNEVVVSKYKKLSEEEQRIKGDKVEEEETVTIRGVTDQISDEKILVKGGESEEESTSKIVGFFKKINPFNKKNKEEDLISEEDQTSEEESSLDLSAEEWSDSPTANETEIKKATNQFGQLIEELDKGSFAKAIEEIKSSATEVDTDNEKAKEFSENLVTKFVQEKSKIVEKIKSIEATVAQKEIEIKNDQIRFRNELERMQSQLKQKNATMAKIKDEMIKIREEANHKGKDQDSAQLKGIQRKLQQVQNLYKAAQDEKRILMRRLEESKQNKAAVTSQISRQSNSTVSRTELTAVQARLERSQRQLDEFKKTNKNLVEKLSDSEKRKIPEQRKMVELKTKLQEAVKLATRHKAESDELKEATSALEKEKAELLNEIKLLKAQKAA